MPHNTKSKAKRMGIKSVFSCKNGRLVITRFGKGNNAEVAVECDARGKELSLPYRVEKSFTIQDIDEDIDFVRGILDVHLDNPTDEVPTDYLGLKGTLEKEFFGKEFPNDNVRIQIIHNILDVIKILGIYVNDIVYCISNLQEGDTPKEILGQSINNSRAETILKSIVPYMGFFGEAFKIPPKRKDRRPPTQSKLKGNPVNPEEAYNKSVIRILSTVRNNTMHLNEKKRMSFLFNEKLSKYFSGNNGNWETIVQYNTQLIERINKDFLQHSTTNLNILFELLNASSEDEKKNIAEEYYRFSILKNGKNLGLNMRKLREIMIDTYCPEVKDKKHDTYRKKMYTILDYVLFCHVSHSEDLESMVSELRETIDEEAKDELYQTFAECIWDEVQDQILPFFARFDQEFDFSVYSTEKKFKNLITDVQLKTEGSEPLVQLLAFLCNFWDGKEVNELLSAYIHKFESIQSFINVLESVGEKVEFADLYQPFNQKNYAGRVAQQLRVLASIGKMKPDLEGAKRPLYKAALETLGIQGHTEWSTDEWLEENILPGSSASKEVKKAIHPFRNFIANNVIESRRFMYLVRYTKPLVVRALMSNRIIVHYVLSRLPDKQIDTYYGNITDVSEEISLDVKINRLTNRLTNFSFSKLLEKKKEICENSLRTTNKNVEIERLKALTGLYLTVAFVAVKNLVKINARYYIAFAAYDRDYALMEKKDESVSNFVIHYSINGKKDSNEYYALTRYFLDKEEKNDYHPEAGQPFDKEACRRHLDSVRRHYTKKWRDIFCSNIEEALQVSPTGYLGNLARNHAAHLNVLMQALPKYVEDFRKNGPGMTSYFELYHFLLQKMILEEVGLEIPDKWQNIVKSGVPCNDWIKVTYVTLGYNLPRYKNLTIEALFDPDSSSGKERSLQNRKKKP